ncbi:MAG: hypothetical protein RL240_1070 [Planctomycetota bacterium]|jgi:hypothetical protein
MADAKVENIEALEEFSRSIEAMRSETSKNSDDIRDQFQRVAMWLGKELPEYWANELRIAQNKWIEAREELMRCQSKTRSEDETSCLLQRKALERATHRRQLCEQRARLVPQLAMEWERFAQEALSSIRQLDDLAESTLPLAQRRLIEMIEVLKRYAAQ